jgi:hypothetical protein
MIKLLRNDFTSVADLVNICVCWILMRTKQRVLTSVSSCCVCSARRDEGTRFSAQYCIISFRPQYFSGVKVKEIRFRSFLYVLCAEFDSWGHVTIDVLKSERQLNVNYKRMNVFPFLNESVAQFILCRYERYDKEMYFSCTYWMCATYCTSIISNKQLWIREISPSHPCIHYHGVVQRHTSYFIYTYAILFSFINIKSLYTISGSLCTLYLNIDGQ